MSYFAVIAINQELLALWTMVRPAISSTAHSLAISHRRRSSELCSCTVDMHSRVTMLDRLMAMLSMVSPPCRNSSSIPWHMATCLSMAERTGSSPIARFAALAVDLDLMGSSQALTTQVVPPSRPPARPVCCRLMVSWLDPYNTEHSLGLGLQGL